MHRALRHMQVLTVIIALNVGHASGQERHLLARTLDAMRRGTTRPFTGYAYVIGGAALGDRVDDSTGARASWGAKATLIADASSVRPCTAGNEPLPRCHFVNDDPNHSVLITVKSVSRSADSVKVIVATEGREADGFRRWFETIVTFRRLGNELGSAVVTKGAHY